LYYYRVPSGEILETVVADNNLTEAIAVGYLYQLLQAIDTLHKIKVAHLDIRVSLWHSLVCGRYFRGKLLT